MGDSELDAVQIEDGRLSFDSGGGSLTVEGGIIVRSVTTPPGSPTDTGIGSIDGPGDVTADAIDIISTSFHVASLFALRPLTIRSAAVDVERGRLDIFLGGSIDIIDGGSLKQTNPGVLRGNYYVNGADLRVDGLTPITTIQGSVFLVGAGDIVDGVAATGLQSLTTINGQLALETASARSIPGPLTVNGYLGVLTNSDLAVPGSVNGAGTQDFGLGVVVNSSVLRADVDGALSLQGAATLRGDLTNGRLITSSQGTVRPEIIGSVSELVSFSPILFAPVAGPALTVTGPAGLNTADLRVRIDIADTGWVDGTPTDLVLVNADGGLNSSSFNVVTVTKGFSSTPVATPYAQTAFDAKSIGLRFLHVDQAPTFSPTVVPSGAVGTAYTHTFVATGVPSTMTYSLGTGSTPPGLTLGADGVLSGSPTTSGTYTFEVVASNGVNPDAVRSVTMLVGTPPVFSPTTVPNATRTLYYEHPFEAIGDPSTIVYGVDDETALPPGLSVSAEGYLLGTPTASGTFGFVITASNGVGPVSLRPVTLVVDEPVAPAFVEAAPSLSATLGVLYPTYTFVASGFPAPSFTVTGALPPGLNFTGAGELSGTPSLAGSFTFTVRASNGVSPEVEKVITLTVSLPPTSTTTSTTTTTTTTTSTTTTTTTLPPTTTTTTTSTSTPPASTTSTSTSTTSTTPASLLPTTTTTTTTTPGATVAPPVTEPPVVVPDISLVGEAQIPADDDVFSAKAPLDFMFTVGGLEGVNAKAWVLAMNGVRVESGLGLPPSTIKVRTTDALVRDPVFQLVVGVGQNDFGRSVTIALPDEYRRRLAKRPIARLAVTARTGEARNDVQIKADGSASAVTRGGSITRWELSFGDGRNAQRRWGSAKRH